MASKGKIIHPHDHYFKLMMSDPSVIKEFCNRYLPANLKSSLNFETIDQRKTSYISDELKLQEMDLLFSVEFNHQPGYLYLLVEHVRHEVTPCKYTEMCWS